MKLNGKEEMKNKFTNTSALEIRMQEERRKMRTVGIIVGFVVFIVFLFVAKDLELSQRIPLGIAFGWTTLNTITYQGRFHPKIVYAVKIGYPVLLLILYWEITGTI